MTTEHFTRRLPLVAWTCAILLGAVQVWNYRFTISTDDSISYLDIADAYLRGDWGTALNAHWSPLYSWILALALVLVKPSPWWELPLVKIVNFAVYLGALAAFSFFLRELIKYNKGRFERDSQGSLQIPEWVWLIGGYVLFLWASLNWTTIYGDTPDMTTAACVYLAAGWLLRIQSPSGSWSNFVLFGLALGFGYLSKAPMLAISLVFLMVALLSIGNLRRSLPRMAIAGVFFALVVAPFITALSIDKGRLTFSDAGKYVYVTFVNPGFPAVPLVHYQGDLPKFGKLLNPTRQIAASPAAYEFATPISATYPPWYEPSYWYTGLEIQFDFKQQARVLVKNLLFYWNAFLGVLVFGYVAFVIAAGRPMQSIAALRTNWILVVPAVFALAIFCVATDLPKSDLPVQPAMRYVAPFVVLLFAGIFSSVRLPDSDGSKRWVSAVVSAAVLAVGLALVADPIEDRAFRRTQTAHVSWLTAESLIGAGVSPGDKIARLGVTDYPYWARLAGVRIIAEIPDEEEFWKHSATARAKTLEAIRRTGSRVVVTATGREKSISASAEGWVEIGNGAHIYRFDNDSAATGNRLATE